MKMASRGHENTMGYGLVWYGWGINTKMLLSLLLRTRRHADLCVDWFLYQHFVSGGYFFNADFGINHLNSVLVLVG
jgi:hypothetical protein